MHYRKLEFKIPVFFGCLCSLALCTLLAGQRFGFPIDYPTEETEEIIGEVEAEPLPETEENHFLAGVRPPRHDFIGESFREAGSRDRVIDFFAEICPSREVAETILVNAEKFSIPPALAFSLAWEESRLNPQAVNRKNRDESIDRGLFQLNNRSFPRLELASFFDPALNSYYGMSHLRHCLNTGGTEVAALAMYNAGTGRVRSSGTPKTTLDYISRILENKREIEDRFTEYESLFLEQLENIPEVAELEPAPPRFVPLMPLSGTR